MKHLAPALVLSLLALAGCSSGPSPKELLDFATASVPLASAEADAQAKRFTPAPGKALIYVYRGGSDPGAARPFTVAMDDKAVGALVGRTYFALEAEPGRHVISLQDGSSTALRIDAAAGSRHFVELGTETGYSAPTGYLIAASESDGRAAINRARLAHNQSGAAAAAKPAAASPAASPAATASAKPVAAASAKPAADPALDPAKSYPQQLRELKQLQNEGIITEQEFEAKKKQILERM